MNIAIETKIDMSAAMADKELLCGLTGPVKVVKTDWACGAVNSATGISEATKVAPDRFVVWGQEKWHRIDAITEAVNFAGGHAIYGYEYTLTAAGKNEVDALVADLNSRLMRAGGIEENWLVYVEASYKVGVNPLPALRRAYPQYNIVGNPEKLRITVTRI